MSLEIRLTSWSEDAELLTQIRTRVFVEEQNVAPEIELDGLDPQTDTHHFLAYLNKQAIAAGRVLPNGKMGRICVLKEFRGKGYGEQFLRALTITCLENLGLKKLYLHAQLDALPLYKKCGFEPWGDTFFEANIEHKAMGLSLDSQDKLERVYHDSVIRLTRPMEFIRHICQILNAGRKTVDILSQQLSPQIFTQEVSEHISSLARGHRQARIRILVQDTRSLAAIKHPVVELAKRLPSSISILKLREQPQRAEEGYIIVDRRQLVFFNSEEEFNGFANYKARPEAENRLEEFAYLLQHQSERDPNLSNIII